MYSVKDEGIQRPRVCIMELTCRRIAAPIRKLCPLNCESSTPALFSAWRKDWTIGVASRELSHP